MPLVTITTKRPLDSAGRRGLADGVHRALVEVLGVPPGDRFQIVCTAPDDLFYDPSYLDIERTDGIVIIQIALATGRTIDQKKRLFRHIADVLSSEQGVRPEDVFVGLVEVPRENWSFGNGVAQYADAPPPHLAAVAPGAPGA